MLSRCLETKEALVSTLALLEIDIPTVTLAEWKIVEKLISVLQIFKAVTEEISWEKSVSRSIVKIINNRMFLLRQDPEMPEQINSVIKSTTSGTLVLFLILNAVMLIVGSIKKDDCPTERLIPIYLIVAGSYWVFKNYKPIFDDNGDRRWYCNRTAYYLAFGLLTVNWILLGITVILLCCAFCVAICLRPK
ncbi:hypothetical protein RI129_000626 [Pyrocoelia pectoralis]|uniref:Uncharacterized protein n=1 Tax=Pyrocoelia pectoralis TaxID=417401 RepID=A0AAN7ZP17_9COLE